MAIELRKTCSFLMNGQVLWDIQWQILADVSENLVASIFTVWLQEYKCTYVVGQLSSRTHQRVLAVAALDKRLSMVWWRSHISVSQLYCWSMAVSEWHLLPSACVLVCRRENVGAWIRAANEHKILVKLGKSGDEVGDMLVQVYGDNAMKKTAVYRWLKLFSEGRENFTHEERLGLPATCRTEENIAKIRQIVRENRRLSDA